MYWIIPVVTFVLGFLVYHWILGSAGFFGNLAANAVEKRLDKTVDKILGKEKKKQLTKYERLRLRRKERENE